MNTVDSRRQLPWWGCNRSHGSSDHSAHSHCLSVGAEGEVPMILSPGEGLCHSYRSIHPHKTVRQVVVGPPHREAPKMQDGRHIPFAGLLRGWRRFLEGGISRTSEARVGLLRPSAPFLGRLWVSLPRIVLFQMTAMSNLKKCFRKECISTSEFVPSRDVQDAGQAVVETRGNVTKESVVLRCVALCCVVLCCVVLCCVVLCCVVLCCVVLCCVVLCCVVLCCVVLCCVVLCCVVLCCVVLCCVVLCCVVLCCVVLCCVVLCCVVLCCVALRCVALCCAVLCCVVLCCVVLCCVVLCCVVLCCVVLCCVVLCCVVLCCVVLCCVVLCCVVLCCVVL